MQLVQAQPKTLADVAKLSELSAGFVRKQGPTLVGLLAEFKADYAEYGSQQLTKPLSPSEGKHLKQLKHRLRELAEQQWQIAPEILLRKADYQLVMRSRNTHGDYQWPAEISGWRQQLMQQPVENFLNSGPLEPAVLDEQE